MYDRLELLIGSDKIKVLNNSTILIVGLGGVGGYTLEALVRSGIGNFVLVDFDKIELSNLNRQLLTNLNNIGEYKCDAARDRVLSINNSANVKIINKKITVDDCIDLVNNVDFVIDACDDSSVKIELIKVCKSKNIPIVSCMGTGNKFNSNKLKLCDIEDTSYDPLARKVRLALKKEGIKDVMVVSSTEVNHSKSIGTIAYMPAIAGLMMAEYVIKKLGGINE